jgi:hypothetical protein
MSRMPVARGRSLRLGVVVAYAALTLLPPGSGAQTPVSEADTAEEAHPAHIHAGTCDQLGEVLYPLADVAAPSGEKMGAAGGHPVKINEGNHVELSLEEFLVRPHAINVHLSAEEIDTYIACGNISGVVQQRENGEGMEIVIALAELNNSGHVGVAWLGADEERGTSVTVSLIEPDAMSGAGGAVAEVTPAT